MLKRLAIMQWSTRSLALSTINIAMVVTERLRTITEVSVLSPAPLKVKRLMIMATKKTYDGESVPSTVKSGSNGKYGGGKPMVCHGCGEPGHIRPNRPNKAKWVSSPITVDCERCGE